MNYSGEVKINVGTIVFLMIKDMRATRNKKVEKGKCTCIHHLGNWV